MHTAPSLLELQRQFLAALYDPDASGSVAAIAGNGLQPDARLHIYRHGCEAIHDAALRTTYPAVLALVGADFFGQVARGYRRAHPSRSGNLQAFGAGFAQYLGSVPEARTLAYLPDVARLEWLRQESALAADAGPMTPESFARQCAGISASLHISLHPSVRLLASRYAVLTIWRYALRPTTERLTLADAGESVVLWREDGEVAMAALDGASFACIAALVRGNTLDAARAAAMVLDAGFDLSACLGSLFRHGLIAGTTPFVVRSRKESPACR